MAAYSVLFRSLLGHSFRQASKEDQQTCGKGMEDVFRKWKSSGIKLKAYFGSTSHPDGYSHHWIFEVDSYERMKAMDGDISSGPAGKLLEKYSLDFGHSDLEKWWAAL